MSFRKPTNYSKSSARVNASNCLTLVELADVCELLEGVPLHLLLFPLRDMFIFNIWQLGIWQQHGQLVRVQEDLQGKRESVQA